MGKLSRRAIRQLKKPLQKRILKRTNKCYRQALVDEYPSVFIQSDVDKMDERDMKMKLIELGKPLQSESLYRRYIANLCKLDTLTLSLIVALDKKGKPKRAPITIHAIMDELFERSVNFRY